MNIETLKSFTDKTGPAVHKETNCAAGPEHYISCVNRYNIFVYILLLP